MTSELLGTREHPLVALVGEVTQTVEAYRSGPAWTVPPSELSGLLSDLVAAQRALDAVRLRLLAEADRHQLGEATGHTSTANWWARQARMTRPAAHREVQLARSLEETQHEQVAEAISAGTVSVEQTAEILHAVDTLPAEQVGPALRRDVEAHLVGLAEHHDPKELRLLGRKALDVLAPEIAEETERRRLEAEEHHATATATFSMRPDGEGSVHGRFKIPVLAAEILTKHLAAIAAPRHQHATNTTTGTATSQPQGPEVSRPLRPLRLGAAFVEYLETRAAAGTPKAGGLAATVVVTMTLENLLDTSQTAARLDTGEGISAAQARRLACEAGIIPAVLGGPSQVLDLGRKTRFHTEPQRIAIGLRDQGCCAEGCDWPPAMCHIHHLIAWARGGGTSVEHGRMLCPRHHTLAHDPRYQMAINTHGKITFTRRT